MKLNKRYEDAPESYNGVYAKISNYFDLFKKNTIQLERIFNQLMLLFNLAVDRDKTIFDLQHYVLYNQEVIDNKALGMIMEEVERALFQGLAVEHEIDGQETLRQHYDKIQRIIKKKYKQS